MKLIVGGYAQGKLDYVMRKIGEAPCTVTDGNLPEAGAEAGVIMIIDHLHHFIRERLLSGQCPEDELLQFVEQYPDCILISDEVGNGIVPADAFEREYRERTGRILVELAGRAEEVERVICGIGQRIK